MHEGAGVRQAVGEMRLIAAERVRALDRAPLAPPVAAHDDHRRRLMPIGLGFVEAQGFVRIVLHLIGRVPQVVLALLLHPENVIGVVFRVGVAQLFLDLWSGNDDEFPRLGIGAGHCPARDFENFVDRVFRDRIWPELANAHARLHQVEQRFVSPIVTGHQTSSTSARQYGEY